MAEVGAIIGKLFATVALFLVFISGLLVAIDPADIGAMILEALKLSAPNPLLDAYIMELRIAGVVATIGGFIGFLLSIFFLWRD